MGLCLFYLYDPDRFSLLSWRDSCARGTFWVAEAQWEVRDFYEQQSWKENPN